MFMMQKIMFGRNALSALYVYTNNADNAFLPKIACRNFKYLNKKTYVNVAKFLSHGPPINVEASNLKYL